MARVLIDEAIRENMADFDKETIVKKAVCQACGTGINSDSCVCPSCGWVDEQWKNYLSYNGKFKKWIKPKKKVSFFIEKIYRVIYVPCLYLIVFELILIMGRIGLNLYSAYPVTYQEQLLPDEMRAGQEIVVDAVQDSIDELSNNATDIKNIIVNTVGKQRNHVIDSSVEEVK